MSDRRPFITPIPILTVYRRAKKSGEDPLDDIICADFKNHHTIKKTVRELHHPDLVRKLRCGLEDRVDQHARNERISYLIKVL